MRTMDASSYRRLTEAWSTFGPRWAEIRRVVASWPSPFPPSGESTDDRDDPEPSQRAIVWRALDWRPAETLAIIRRCRSWSQVIAAIIASEDRLREDAGLAEREAAWYRRQDPTHLEAAQSVGSILTRMRESMP